MADFSRARIFVYGNHDMGGLPCARNWLETHGVQNVSVFAAEKCTDADLRGICASYADAGVDNATTNTATPATGYAFATVDPAFTDAANGDYTIRLSDCVDVGLPYAWHDGAKDLKGDDRVMGGAVDIGCYECALRGLVLLLY